MTQTTQAPERIHHWLDSQLSIARFYGGIHYKFGVDNGFANGNAIGQHILNTLTK